MERDYLEFASKLDEPEKHSTETSTPTSVRRKCEPLGGLYVGQKPTLVRSPSAPSRRLPNDSTTC